MSSVPNHEPTVSWTMLYDTLTQVKNPRTSLQMKKLYSYSITSSLWDSDEREVFTGIRILGEAYYYIFCLERMLNFYRILIHRLVDNDLTE